MGNRTLDTLEEIAKEISSIPPFTSVSFPVILNPAPAMIHFDYPGPHYNEFSTVGTPASTEPMMITPIPLPEMDNAQIDQAIMEVNDSINQDILDIFNQMLLTALTPKK